MDIVFTVIFNYFVFSGRKNRKKKKCLELVVMVVSVKSKIEFCVKVMNLVFIGKEMDFLLYFVYLL